MGDIYNEDRKERVNHNFLERVTRAFDYGLQEIPNDRLSM